MRVMPKTQRDIMDRLVKIGERKMEVEAIENALAQKDARAAYVTEKNRVIKEIKNSLSAEGAKDWVGQVVVTENEIRLGTRADGTKSIFPSTYFEIKTENLPDEVRESVKRLKDQEWVKFNITSIQKFFTNDNCSILATSSDGKVLVAIDRLFPEK